MLRRQHCAFPLLQVRMLPADDLCRSMNAGTDLDCGTTYSANLQTAINLKLTTEGAVRKAVTRMYGSLVRLGYFDSASTQPLRQLGWSAVNTPYAESTAYRAAQEGLVLLKNDGTLPLSTTKYKTVALVGPWGNVGAMYDGGQGSARIMYASTAELTRYSGGIYNGPGPTTVTLQQGLTAAFRTLNFAQGTQINTTSTANFSAALTAARSADVIIFAGGIDSSLEREAQDRDEINYPGNQLDLVSQLAGLGKPLVVVQFGGGSVDNAPLKSDSRVKAILWAGYPGPVGGKALADTLTGKAAPAGRLPYTQYPTNYVSVASRSVFGVCSDITISLGQ
jgi:beta-D-xylosidase 4